MPVSPPRHSPSHPPHPSDELLPSPLRRRYGGIEESLTEPLNSGGHSDDDLLPFELKRHRLSWMMPYSSAAILNVVQTSFLFGYSIGVLNSCMNSISLYFELCGTPWDAGCRASQLSQATINSIIFLGAVVGSLWSGRLVRQGRRYSLQLACTMFIAGGVIGAAAMAPAGVAMLTISRLLSGVGLGIVTVVSPMYISEMTPSVDRGYYGAMHQMVIGVGIFTSIALGLPLRPNSSNDEGYILSGMDVWWWRWMLGFQCLPALSCLFGFEYICPSETPHFLIDNHKTADAAETIMHIYQSTSISQVEPVLLSIERAVQEARGLVAITLKEAVWESYYRFGILLGFFLAALQQLSGINVVVSSSDELFSMAGLLPSTVTWASTLMALSNVVASGIASLLIERSGRRKLLLWGLLGQCLTMGPVGVVRCLSEKRDIDILTPDQLTVLSVVGTILFVTSFSVALGPIVWIYLSEIYPVEIRGPALGACGAINWLTAFAVVFFGKFLHITTAFILFGGICFIGLIFSYLWVLETKGSSIEDSPVSPQSLRSESQLIRQAKEGRVDVTIQDIREKIRSVTSASSLLPSHYLSPNGNLWDDDSRPSMNNNNTNNTTNNIESLGEYSDEQNCLGLTVEEDLGSPQSQYFNFYSQVFGKKGAERNS